MSRIKRFTDALIEIFSPLRWTDGQRIARILGYENIVGDLQGVVVQILAQLQVIENSAHSIEDIWSEDENVDVTRVLVELDTLFNALRGIIEKIDEFSEVIESSIENVDPSDLVQNIADRFIGWLIVRYVNYNFPAAHCVLNFLKIFKSKYHPELNDRPEFTEHLVDWGRISIIMQEPIGEIKSLIKWGQPDVQLAGLLTDLQEFLWLKMIPVGISNTPPFLLQQFEGMLSWSFPAEEVESNTLEIVLWSDPKLDLNVRVSLVQLPFLNGDQIMSGLGLSLESTSVANLTFGLSQLATLNVSGGFGLSAGAYLALAPNQEAKVDIISISNSFDNVSVSVSFSTLPGSGLFIGQPGASRLEIDRVVGEAGVILELQDGKSEFFAEIESQRGQVVLSSEGADGFLKMILPTEPIRSELDIATGISSLDGFYFRGSGSLEITIPLHVSLGPFLLESLYLCFDIGGDTDLMATIAVTGSAELGPVSVSVQQIGIRNPVYFHANRDGNLGPIQVDTPHFKPPLGAGLALNAGGINGGGFLEFDDPNKRYAGILALNFGEIGLTAIGLITTRMPDGSDGYSMLINIGVTFDPPVQLSFGFTLSGVGGLIGINRTMEVETLQHGIRNRSLDSILFPDPDSVIANSSSIISNMRAVFPPVEDRYVVGPMVQVGWGSPAIIKAEVGIFLELPEPVRIVLLGQLSVSFPEEEQALVVVNLDVLGVLDFAKEELTFQASLFDSRILNYPISGDSAFLLGWGNNPRFALSLGGFHPKSTPPPPPVVFGDLSRLNISLSKGGELQLACRAYLELTPNSLKFGAKVDLYASGGGAEITGYVGFDTFIYFSPFSFEAWIGAGVNIKYEGMSLMDVDLSFLLSGPTPWLARGKAKIKLLFVSVKVGFEITWGSSKKATLTAVDPWNLLKEALTLSGNWGSVLPEGRTLVESIRSRKEDTPDMIVVHPLGRIEVRQNIVPLGVGLKKAGNAPITGHDRFDVTEVKIDGVPLDIVPVEEFFARGQYENLSGQQMLSLPSFEKMKAGVSGAASESVSIEGECVSQPLEYESILIREDRTSQQQVTKGRLVWEDGRILAKATIKRRSTGRAGPSKRFSERCNRPMVGVIEERFCIANSDDLTRADLSEQLSRANRDMTRMMADQTLEEQLKQEPGQTGRLIVVPECEVSEEAA